MPGSPVRSNSEIYKLKHKLKGLYTICLLIRLWQMHLGLCITMSYDLLADINWSLMPIEITGHLQIIQECVETKLQKTPWSLVIIPVDTSWYICWITKEYNLGMVKQSLPKVVGKGIGSKVDEKRFFTFYMCSHVPMYKIKFFMLVRICFSNPS